MTGQRRNLILISGLLYISFLLWKGTFGAGGKDDEQAAIMKNLGDGAIMEMYGYSVYIQTHIGSKHGSCTGTIITKFTIVTSARCVFQGQEKPFRVSQTAVIAGSIIGTHGNQEKIEKIIPHPDYKETEFQRVNDIALITLLEPMDVNMPPSNLLWHAIGTVDIGSDYNPVVGNYCYLSIYGSPSSKVPDRMVLLPVIVRSESECNQVYPRQNFDPSLQICAAVANTTLKIQCDATGGSLFCKEDGRMKFFGVMSKSVDKTPSEREMLSSCYEKDRQRVMVFTRVPRYKGWVDSYIKTLWSPYNEKPPSPPPPSSKRKSEKGKGNKDKDKDKDNDKDKDKDKDTIKASVSLSGTVHEFFQLPDQVMGDFI